MNTWTAIILTSAAVGALVSSVIAVVGQWFERKARRKELLFMRSLECAKRANEFLLEAGKLKLAATGRIGKMSFPDEVVMAGMYYRWLEHIFDHGELSEEAKRSPSYINSTAAMKEDFRPSEGDEATKGGQGK